MAAVEPGHLLRVLRRRDLIGILLNAMIGAGMLAAPAKVFALAGDWSFAVLAAAAIYEASVGATLHWLTGWFIYPALIYCGACVLSKRLHDRGRSGWWAALVLFAIGAIWPQPNSFFDFPFTLVVIWAVTDLAIMPGETGTNRFGGNPLRPAVVAV